MSAVSPEDVTVRKPDSECDQDITIIDDFTFPAWYVPGTPWDQLTPAQQQELQDRYRFSGYRPSAYQVITGVWGSL